MNESSLTLLEEEILYNKTIQKKRQMHWTLYQSLHRQPMGTDRSNPVDIMSLSITRRMEANDGAILLLIEITSEKQSEDVKLL